MKKLICVGLVLCMAVGLFGCGKAEQIDPNAIARVDDKYVTTVEELIAAIDPSGNTAVTLLKDIDTDGTLKLPYTCTIDFNGHTLTTNPKRGIGMIVEDAGQENPALKLVNGSLISYGDCVRAKKGAVVIENMQLFAQNGPCLSLHDATDAYRDINRVSGSFLATGGGACLAWNESETDFSGTGVSVADSQLVSTDPEGGYLFKKSSSATAGMIRLEAGVTLYSYGKLLAKDMLFEGAELVMTAGETLVVNGETVTGLNKWSEDGEDKVVDVLMIGNSFCYYFTEELRDMAAAEGIQLNLTNLYYGGRSVKAHWNRLQDGQADYDFWITNAFGRFKHPTIKTITEAMAYGDWDVITLQQHFDVERTLTYETALESCTPYAKELFDYLKANFPEAELYWQQTWAYQIGYPTNENGKMPVDSAAVQLRQHTQIRDVSITVCEENNVKRIPSGDAWHIARSGVLGDTLCKNDCCHDGDTGGGQYLNACVWFEVLTGRSCIGNTWRPDDYRLSEEKVAQLQNAAHEAVAAVYGADYAK